MEIWITGGDKSKIAKCGSRMEKEKIMENKKKLGTERKYIDNGLAWKEARIREEVIKKKKEMRGRGVRTRVVFNKVSMDEGEWTWSEKEKWVFKAKRQEEGKQSEIHMLEHGRS